MGSAWMEILLSDIYLAELGCRLKGRQHNTWRLFSRRGSRCRRASLIISTVSGAFRSEHASWLLISQSEARGWPQSQGKYSRLMRVEAGGRDKIFLIEEARRRDRVFQQTWNLLHLAVQNHCVNYSVLYCELIIFTVIDVCRAIWCWLNDASSYCLLYLLFLIASTVPAGVLPASHHTGLFEWVPDGDTQFYKGTFKNIC